MFCQCQVPSVKQKLVNLAKDLLASLAKNWVKMLVQLLVLSWPFPFCLDKFIFVLSICCFVFTVGITRLKHYYKICLWENGWWLYHNFKTNDIHCMHRDLVREPSLYRPLHTISIWFKTWGLSSLSWYMVRLSSTHSDLECFIPHTIALLSFFTKHPSW